VLPQHDMPRLPLI